MAQVAQKMYLCCIIRLEIKVWNPFSLVKMTCIEAQYSLKGKKSAAYIGVILSVYGICSKDVSKYAYT